MESTGPKGVVIPSDEGIAWWDWTLPVSHISKRDVNTVVGQAFRVAIQQMEVNQIGDDEWEVDSVRYSVAKLSPKRQYVLLLFYCRTATVKNNRALERFLPASKRDRPLNGTVVVFAARKAPDDGKSRSRFEFVDFTAEQLARGVKVKGWIGLVPSSGCDSTSPATSSTNSSYLSSSGFSSPFLRGDHSPWNRSEEDLNSLLKTERKRSSSVSERSKWTQAVIQGATSTISASILPTTLESSGSSHRVTQLFDSDENDSVCGCGLKYSKEKDYVQHLQSALANIVRLNPNLTVKAASTKIAVDHGHDAWTDLESFGIGDEIVTVLQTVSEAQNMRLMYESRGFHTKLTRQLNSLDNSQKSSDFESQEFSVGFAGGLIQNELECESALASIKGAGEIGLECYKLDDTGKSAVVAVCHHCPATGIPLLSLFILSTENPHRVFLINSLGNLLSTSCTLKIVHDGRNTIELLRLNFGITVHPIFDSHVVISMVAGLGGFSYREREPVANVEKFGLDHVKSLCGVSTPVYQSDRLSSSETLDETLAASIQAIHKSAMQAVTPLLAIYQSLTEKLHQCAIDMSMRHSYQFVDTISE